ncbi:zinc metallopeptidase [Halanaerobacter jeridensis]|uniref:Zn-dependent membrane protease YugP n=1 Tax=Halanaerobacter jeridensis TaxID=706427 RepID=A0A938XUJ2_9FIRM|nr:zinc metallopeptidase [Halanaerobacter jeridensis]MBM7555510.1 Zn-dependent membrane protease YugP [Halanaerobacter jeridensis]
MPFLFFDPTMILLIPAIILAGYAQMKVKSTFNKYLEVRAKIGKSGAQVARELLDQNGLSHINVTRADGKLSDHYDPKNEVLKLSPEVYGGSSLASLGVAAHETGHAIQDKVGYAPLRFRHSLFPVASFGSQAGPILAVLGFLFHAGFLINVGIIVFTAAVLFQIVTLPVEFNASSRALKLLRQNNYLNSQETKGAKKVLNAAALTYVASAVVAIGHLIRLLVLSRMMDD